MASKDYANIAAALAAGWKEIDTDRGASFTPAARRFMVVLDKMVVGEAGVSGTRLEVTGEGSSLGNAQAVALAAANNLRLHRYGADTAVSTGSHGGAYTTDVS